VSASNWFVVQTKPHKEQLALENLQRQGFIAYFPQTVVPKRRRQRWYKVSEPLFPRYVFVQLNVGIDNFSPIRSTLGVIDLVKFGTQPASIPASVITTIQNMEQEIQDSSTDYPKWQVGEELEILDGPFSGLKGIFLKRDGIVRVTLLLDILGQQSRFSIPAHYLASGY
jgi:transcriptional antiterminator RfaH